MSFVKEAVNRSLDIWNACLKTPFVEGLRTGELSDFKFKNYMVQDSIYLKYYAKIFGKAIYLSETIEEIRAFYSVLSFVNDAETEARLSHLESVNITDDDIEKMEPLPENKSYIDFMMAAADSNKLLDILAAVLPCMLSYSYIGRELAKDEASRNSKYWDFIQEYASDECYKTCKHISDLADAKISGLPEAEKERLYAVFVHSGELELDFWKMSYRDL